MIPIILALIITCGWHGSSLAQSQITTVYIVRHAEKADNSLNPPLSPNGLKRAEALAHVLKDEGIKAVYVTEYTRTQQTGAPVALAAEVDVIRYPAIRPEQVVEKILAEHTGSRVLIVGHSNTVDDIATNLGAAGLTDLGDNQFDRLFIVHHSDDIVLLDRLRYGAETP